jgi:hypothetical protein
MVGEPRKRLNRMAKAHAVEILESVLVAARAGDMTAAKLILDRIWPLPKSGPVQLALRPTRNVADVREAMHDLLGKMASGDVTPEDGRVFISVMRDIVMVHSAETLPFTGPPLEINNARQSLNDRIQKAIAAREARNGNAAQTIDVTPAE